MVFPECGGLHDTGNGHLCDHVHLCLLVGEFVSSRLYLAAMLLFMWSVLDVVICVVPSLWYTLISLCDEDGSCSYCCHNTFVASRM